VPPLFEKLPASDKVVFAVNVPAVRVVFPLTDMVAGAVKFPNVCVNAPLTTKVVVPPLTLNV